MYMKFFLIACSCLAFGFTLFAFPAVSNADTVTGIAQLANCSGADCSACNVVYMANGIIKWLIGILCIIFAVLLAIAGVKLVTSGGNPGALDAAKSSFTNAIIGFIIVLAAWLVVDTIIRSLVGNGGRLDNGGDVSGWLLWSEVTCQTQTEVDPYKQWEDTIALSMAGVGDWTTVGGVLSSPCTMTGGFSGIPVSYDCSAQIAQCEQRGTGIATLSADKRSVGCIPDADAIVAGGGGGGGGASCPAASEDKMVTIPGTAYKALPAIASKFVAMRTAAAAAGITLNLSSGYRSEAKQVQIWEGKGCDTTPSNCTRKAARPCSKGGNGSNHSQGTAVDISMPNNTTNSIFTWLKANGGTYGFYNNLGAPDPFHWSPSGR